MRFGEQITASEMPMISTIERFSKSRPFLFGVGRHGAASAIGEWGAGVVDIVKEGDSGYSVIQVVEGHAGDEDSPWGKTKAGDPPEP